MTLKHTREKCDEVRKLITEGVDPGAKNKADELANLNSLKAIAAEPGWSIIVLERHSGPISK